MIRGHRAGAAERGALVSACGLFGLSLFKGAAGFLTGSKALLGDACQSAASSASALTSYFGLRKASQRARNPESVISIVLSAVLLVAGLEVGLSSAKELASGPSKAPGWGAVAAAAAGLAAREGLVRYRRFRAEKLGLRSDRSGESRSDYAASFAALAGATAASFGNVLEMPALYACDPAAGIVVSVFVIRMGCRLTAGVARQSEPAAPNDVDIRMLKEAVQGIEGVVAVDEVRVREHGHYLVVDAAIRVNPRISVAEGHDIAMRVRRHLTKRFLHVSDAAVQVQPYDPGYPYKSNHQDEEWSSLLQ
ncbi:cation diffusion facilitator family transporter [Cohnella caldifontis]|uniref:cation diffusion facilitator family transporter n=1 Tax=Cohnella caldifontis TaxID=3027471 RepID=UPI0023EC5BCC|nr:cation diffusion facilitator family transporter [Cohnella sp. YIM B05605]